ncbi:MAG: hypothetical protein OEM91_17405 [Hyphomicrobiales bacterium]|nr:hypothetical protein [Hyphomicrobiales bacterium]
MTEEQQTEVLADLWKADIDVQIFVRMGLTYGVRRGAMMGLSFGPQVNFLTGAIDFNEPGSRQTRKKRPVVPMTKSIRGDLEMVFKAKGRGQKVLARNTAALFAAHMDRVGYGWVTPHVLKHTAITLMLRAGVRDSEVAKMTGTDLRTIHSVYRHHTLGELADIAEARGV